MKCLANIVEFITMGRDWEIKISPAILTNKTCQPSLISGLQKWLRVLKTAIQRVLPSPNSDCWGAEGMQEARWTRKEEGLQTAEVHIKGGNSVSWGGGGGLVSSHTESAKFLKFCSWFFFFFFPCSCCCKLVCGLTPLPASLEHFSQSYWNSLSQAWSPKHSHQIK